MCQGLGGNQFLCLSIPRNDGAGERERTAEKKTSNSQVSESILHWQPERYMITVPYGAACISVTIGRIATVFALLDFENRE